MTDSLESKNQAMARWADEFGLALVAMIYDVNTDKVVFVRFGQDHRVRTQLILPDPTSEISSKIMEFLRIADQGPE